MVFALGRALSGDGSLSFTSFSANFSSTNGVLSAQFGAHYMTFKDAEGSPTARGVSAGGVALISLPLSSRFDNGVPRSAFAFYIGGVPTAMFSGQLNFISVPLVLGVGLPLSPSPYITIRPWVELSPGLNFDTRIQEISTSEAIQSAMDGTLTRQEVEDLVEQGLDIQRRTTVGKRAGLSLAGHLGRRVDLDVNLMLGAGHPGALALGAGLVVRWDALVHELGPDGGDGRRNRGSNGEGSPESCEALAAQYHQTCRLRRPADPARGVSAPGPRSAPARRSGPARSESDTRARAPLPAPSRAPLNPDTPPPAATPAPEKKKPVAPAPLNPQAPPAVPRLSPGELPPLQAAPPRTP